MPKAASSDAQDFFDLVDHAAGEDPDDGLDLEAYLDLEESSEITRLMQEVRGQDAAAAERQPEPGPPAERPSPARPAAAPSGTLPRAAVWPGQAAGAEAAGEAAAARPAGRTGRGTGLDLAAVARALGRVTVQARQLVADCPRCDRASIVVYADRFKCFGCEATGDERALAVHLTGWDARRAAAWLEAAAAGTGVEETDVRRPWRLSFFAR